MMSQKMHIVLFAALAAIAFTAPVAPSVDDIVPEVSFPEDLTPVEALDELSTESGSATTAWTSPDNSGGGSGSPTAAGASHVHAPASPDNNSGGSGTTNAEWASPDNSGAGAGEGEGAAKHCAPGCYPGWPGDNYCDHACNNKACNFDGGDCGTRPMTNTGGSGTTASGSGSAEVSLMDMTAAKPSGGASGGAATASGGKPKTDAKKATEASAKVTTLMSGPSGGCDLPGPDDILRDERTTVACDGVKYDLSVPSACGTGDAACGLIMDVHGSGMNGLMEEEASGIARYGNQAGYIVIQPTSADADWSSDSDGHGEWNEIENMESFLRKMVQDYSAVIDAKKIHVAGFSQGAFVAWNLLCRASDLICSIAPNGFNNHGNYDRSILAKIGHKYSTHSNCWVEGNGPKIARSIFYAQGKHDIFSSPVSFQKSVDKVKKSYGLAGTDGSKVANGCPALLPYRYPHNNRCFENIWRGDSCNVDPRNDRLDFQQKDRQCQFSDGNSLPAGNGYTGVEWQKHSNNGVNVETALFTYKATDDKGKPTVWPFPPSPTGVKAIEGHCFPSSRKDGAPNSAMASCGGKGSFIWGQEAVRFFRANACA